MRKMWINLKKSTMFFKNCKKEIIFVIVFSIFAMLISLLTPSINGNIINKILDSNYKLVIILTLLIGILHIFYTLFNIIISKNYLSFRKKLVLNIRKKVCFALLNFNIETCNNAGQGTIINKIKDDSMKIATILNNLKENIILAFGNIGVLIYIFILNKTIGIYYIIASILLLCIHYYGIKKSMVYKKESLVVQDENTTLLGEIIKGAKDIKALQLKNKFLNKTNNSFERIGELEFKSSMYIEYINKITSFFESVCLGGMVFLSIILIKNNMLTTSDFIVIFMYKGNVFKFSDKMATVINNLSQFNLSMDRIFSILDVKSEKFGKKELLNCKGKITFKEVSFSYDKNNILKNFNLEIEENKFIAIVGKSGAGKSTIFNLITHAIIPEKGEIYLDQTNLNDLSEEAIRASISLVTQQPYLFNLSIKENLDMIDDNFANIKKACKDVGIHEKIESLEKGYDTKLREDASNLSGGEKQKLSIARVLLSKTKIILLDEITNNLDNESTASIKELIEKLKGKYTIIMITHNLEVSKNADRILVLEKGRIVGDGTHTKLLKENKKYQSLYRG